MNKRRYAIAAVVTLAGFAALFAVLPSQGAGTDVSMRDLQYRPGTIRIPAGGAITFENEDRVTHTATCQGQGCPRDSGDIRPGLLRTITFTRAGTYHMVCRYHGEQGMIATVTVGGKAPRSPSPSPSPSPS